MDTKTTITSRSLSQIMSDMDKQAQIMKENNIFGHLIGQSPRMNNEQSSAHFKAAQEIISLELELQNSHI